MTKTTQDKIYRTCMTVQRTVSTYRFENRNCYGEFCFGSNYPMNETKETELQKNTELFLAKCKKEGRLIQGGDQVFIINNQTGEERKVF